MLTYHVIVCNLTNCISFVLMVTNKIFLRHPLMNKMLMALGEKVRHPSIIKMLMSMSFIMHTSPTSLLAPSHAPLYIVEPASARITSASHFSRLRQDFRLVRSWTKMIPWTTCMYTCLVFR